MRKANVSDMFKCARLVNKLGIKEEIFNAQKGSDDLEKIGFNVFYTIFENATTEESENEIYSILSSPFEIPKEDVGKLSPDKLLEYFNECFNFKTLVNFIQRVQESHKA